MFLVEQNAFHALKLAHRGYVMVNGNITMSGHRGRTAQARMKFEPPILKAAHIDACPAPGRTARAAFLHRMKIVQHQLASR